MVPYRVESKELGDALLSSRTSQLTDPRFDLQMSCTTLSLQSMTQLL